FLFSFTLYLTILLFCFFSFLLYILIFFFFFFFTDPSPSEIYTLSLHDALPIWPVGRFARGDVAQGAVSLPHGHFLLAAGDKVPPDRKSTRLNSSHLGISYAVFCLKKKKKTKKKTQIKKKKQKETKIIKSNKNPK